MRRVSFYTRIKGVLGRLSEEYPDFLAIAALLAFAVIIARPLGVNSLLAAHGEDIFIKAVAMHQAWQDGDLLGRWIPSLIHGYGYPVFNFYAPLFFYVAAALMFLPVPVFLAFNAAVFIFLFLSGVSMYVFAREVWGRAGGFLSAVAYLFVPYHLVDLYVRGAIAEFSAFAFAPLVLWAMVRLVRTVDARGMVAGIFATAGLMLTHTISSLFFIPAGGAYLLVLFFTGMKRDLGKLLAGIGMIAGGAALSAYFWVPALVEKKYVQTERLVTGYYEYSQHFVSLGRLLYSPWNDGLNKPMPVMVGLLHMLLAAAVIVFWKRINARVRGAWVQVAFFLLFFIAACFFMLPASGFVWKAIPLLSFAQFPWRFLTCTALALSLLAGGIAGIVEARHVSKVVLGAVLVIVAVSIPYCHTFGYKPVHYVASKEYLLNSTPLDNMEYLPVAVRKISFAAGPQKLQPWVGEADVTLMRGAALDETYRVHARTPAALGYATYYFPGWEAAVDGHRTDIHEDNIYGLIAFAVPPGEHEVRVHFTTTPVRRAAEAVSAVTLVFLLAVLCFYSGLGARLRKISPSVR